MHFTKILLVCLGLAAFTGTTQTSTIANSTSSSVNRVVWLDGGDPLPRPPLVADGGDPLPRPPLVADGGDPLPRPPQLLADGGDPLPRPPLVADGGDPLPRPPIALTV
jgi:hypothetical protein